ncbi:MAG: class I SAM-dependent methyltransferase, partial [Flavobacteriales bacterium]
MKDKDKLKDLFKEEIFFEDKLILLSNISTFDNQNQTNDTFTEKWKVLDKTADSEEYDFESFQKNWFLELYGFSSEKELGNFLKGKIIIDAGCGLGYKSSWFASLAPDSLVIGIDFSNSAILASQKYKNIENLYFVQGDIAETKIKLNS